MPRIIPWDAIVYPVNIALSLLSLALRDFTSVAISDAIIAAQTAFTEGEFQPETFSRCVCSLLEAFEGGDNAVRLCVARLLERYRPYLGSNIVALEVKPQ